MDAKVTATVKETIHKQIDFGKAANFMAKNQAMVGVPQESSSRADSVSNAELLFIHTNGSPLKGIPARPVVEPAIEQDTAKIAECLKEAAIAALDGNLGGARSGLEKAGMYGENAVKDYFTSGSFAPNKQSTINKKGSDRPLIDTGALRSSITYVVREK